MSNVVGIDSRQFLRHTRNRKIDGNPGTFVSVIGIAVKVRDYEEFKNQYQKAMKSAFSKFGVNFDYQYYCTNDMREIQEKYNILNAFVEEISKHVEKVHVFYTLFSKKRLEDVKVYGRLSKREKIKLSDPTKTYEELVSGHLIQCFPAICAWKLTKYLNPNHTQFHLDSYGGHICEAEEELNKSGFTKIVYPGGDCSNPVISTADLLLDLLDRRLETNRLGLMFENIRPTLPEFGENLLVYPIHNLHLSKITPLDKIPIDTMPFIKRPVFWVFKGSQLIDSGTVKRSNTYRNLLDFASSSSYNGVVKMFERGKDIEYVQKGDYGVYLNKEGKDIIDSYRKIGKVFIPLNIDTMVSCESK